MADKNIILHPVDNGALDTNTNLYPQTTTGQVTGLSDALNLKANKDGYYETLRSGDADFADQLNTKQTITRNTIFSIDTTAGGEEVSSRMRLEKEEGFSIPLQQMVPNPNTWPTSSSSKAFPSGTRIISGHKYLYVFDYTLKEGVTSSYAYLKRANSPSAANAIAVNVGVNQAFYPPVGIKQFDYDLVSDGTTNNTGSNFWLALGGNGLADINFNYIVFYDLTQMFGTAVADRLYSMETSSAGSGVAQFRKFFPKPYYPYSATATMIHENSTAVKTTGYNQWDEEWESGAINASGENYSHSTSIRSKNFIPVLAGENYYFKSPTKLYTRYYDASKNIIGTNDANGYGAIDASATGNNRVRKMPANAAYLRFYVDSTTTYNHDICISIHWDNTRDGEYEAYTENTYALAGGEKMGILEVDANGNIVANGDQYYRKDDGTGEKKHRYGIVDLGTLNWEYESGNSRFYAYTSAFPAAPKTATQNFICGLYVYGATSGTTDMVMQFASGTLYIKNTAYTDPATFKTAMSGVYLVYELATPTTETVDGYPEYMKDDNWGTMQFVDDRTLPLPAGNEIIYQPDLKAKLEVTPSSPDADGLYLMERKNGQNSYIAFPSNPTSNGTYTMKCTVSSGSATLFWQVDA